ncbi:hypothetical protein niasHT_013092 [Heterodera trifolii]|uniref:Uncharacterized protein n=1 Tax=Heterodera trifolii TaxID=157864 RepID=A0ABD2L739_9BILA
MEPSNQQQGQQQEEGRKNNRDEKVEECAPSSSAPVPMQTDPSKILGQNEAGGGRGGAPAQQQLWWAGAQRPGAARGRKRMTRTRLGAALASAEEFATAAAAVDTPTPWASLCPPPRPPQLPPPPRGLPFSPPLSSPNFSPPAQFRPEHCCSALLLLKQPKNGEPGEGMGDDGRGRKGRPPPIFGVGDSSSGGRGEYERV